MRRLSRQLLEKSQEAFVLAIELYNKPTIRHRVEAFCFLFVNAWELLLKAHIIEGSPRRSVRSIFYPRKRGETEARSLTLDDCLVRAFPEEANGVRRNIECVEKLRNAATHLVVPEVEQWYVGVFQAGIYNYVKLLRSWFGVDVTAKVTPSMLTLVFDSVLTNPAVLRRRYGREVLEFVEQQRKRLLEETSATVDPEFAVVIRHEVVVAGREADADAVLTPAPDGALPGNMIPVPVAKSLEGSHPYLTRDVVDKVKEALPEISFSQTGFLAMVDKLGYKKSNNQYHHYVPRTNTHFYSQACVDRLLALLRSDKTYLRRAVERYARSGRPKSWSKNRQFRPQ